MSHVNAALVCFRVNVASMLSAVVVIFAQVLAHFSGGLVVVPIVYNFEASAAHVVQAYGQVIGANVHGTVVSFGACVTVEKLSTPNDNARTVIFPDRFGMSTLSRK